MFKQMPLSKMWRSGMGGCRRSSPLSKEWRCPYGQVGTKLWVRETWQLIENVWYDYETGSGREASHFLTVWEGAADLSQGCPKNALISFRADGKDPLPCDMIWRSSIHMFRWASRILLEVTDVRVEQVQDISEQDAIAEGFPIDARHWVWGRTPQAKFKDLWDRINEKRGFGWKRNPWVWVINFRRLSPKTNG